MKQNICVDNTDINVLSLKLYAAYTHQTTDPDSARLQRVP